jgi:hypothetical protein
MATIVLFSLLLVFSISLIVGSIVFLRTSYREYCERMDRLDYFRKIVSRNETEIKNLLSNFDREYGEGISGSISHNVRQKVEFSLNTIGTLPLEDQAAETKKLYDMTYETLGRARWNPDDVLAITAPLNSYCKELARKKLDIIKKLAKEEET